MTTKEKRLKAVRTGSEDAADKLKREIAMGISGDDAEYLQQFNLDMVSEKQANRKIKKILENIKKLKADKKANDLPGNISKTELKQLMKATDLKGGGMVSKKKSKVAGKLALRGYGRAIKGKK